MNLHIKGSQFKDKEYWANAWLRFKSGDRSAFEEIYSEYIDTLFAYGSKITTNKEIIQDSIQDLFIDMYKYKINLEKPDSLEFYLLKSFKRLIQQKLKKNNKNINFSTSEFSELNICFNLEDDFLKKESETIKLKSLDEALNSMKPKSKELLFYKFNSNLTYKEIGELIGLKPDTAKKQVYRIIDSLRKNLRIKLPV